MTHHTCDRCGAWQPNLPSAGECRRRSPLPSTSTAHLPDQPRAIWPATTASDWCWEFIPFPPERSAKLAALPRQGAAPEPRPASGSLT